jgi:lipopolysaccharide export system ATP-binding protein
VNSIHTFEVWEIEKKLGKRSIINGISFSCKTGERVAIIGPNGAGKTTTFLIIAGFYKPDKGKILLDGYDITYYPPYKRGIAYLPQECSFFEDMTLYENFEIACELSGVSKTIIEKVAEEFGVKNLLNQKVESLSGGEKRKAEIARLSILSPKFLVLDEPFAGIDPKSVSSLIEFILSISERGIGVIISDHNVRDVLRLCTTIHLIYEGKIVESGTPQDIVRSIKAKQFFFGDTFDF